MALNKLKRIEININPIITLTIIAMYSLPICHLGCSILIMFRHFSVSPIPLVVTLAAFVVMCKLGFWQLDRAEQKRQQIQVFSQQGEVTTEEISQLTKLTSPQQVTKLNGRKVNLQGAILKNTVWLLDNQTYQGKVGYSVITPMLLNGSQSQVLVNWGWVQAGKYRTELPSIQLPNKVSLTGILRTTDFEQFSLQQEQLSDGWPKRVQSVSSVIKSVDKNLVLPILVYANTHIKIQYPQTYKPVVMPPEKHQAYALQWFLLALACLVIFAFASYKNSKQTSTL
jgi:cytochrome oxidase assembly protein ShyY1